MERGRKGGREGGRERKGATSKEEGKKSVFPGDIETQSCLAEF